MCRGRIARYCVRLLRTLRSLEACNTAQKSNVRKDSGVQISPAALLFFYKEMKRLSETI